MEFFKGVREDKRFLLQELDKSVPTGEDADTAKQRRYQRFFYQEAFRNLFTSIRFLNSDQPLRSIALTSSLPAEGKSLVNVLLAKTLSEMGQRVLLIDDSSDPHSWDSSTASGTFSRPRGRQRRPE